MTSPRRPGRPVDVPALLRAAQEHASLTLSQLAAQGGVSRSALMEYLAGRRSPTVVTVDRLLAGCGLQLSTRLEAAWSDVDDLLAALERGGGTIREDVVLAFARTFDHVDPAFRVTWALDGPTALCAQGIALPHDAPHLVLLRDEVLCDWFQQVGLHGSHTGDRRLYRFAGTPLDVAQAELTGELFSAHGFVRLRLVDALPCTFLTPLGDPGAPTLLAPTLPVDEVALADPQLGEALALWRERRVHARSLPG